jgi:ribonuclease HI
VSTSVGFLLSYTDSLEAAGQPLPNDKKGKQEIQKDRRGATNGHQPARQAQHWEPPLDGWVKLNVDGSYLELTGEAGVGVVARDRSRTVIFTAWKYLEKCGSAAEAEAIACVEGLHWANHWGLSQVIVESDCARVISSLKNLLADRSEIGQIVGEARSLTQLMNEWKCSQVKRECNQVANVLASLARRCKHSAAWPGQVPACALPFLHADCNLPMAS